MEAKYHKEVFRRICLDSVFRFRFRLRRRSPGKISASASSDEILDAMDLFPTIARIAGDKVPNDRLMDVHLATGSYRELRPVRFRRSAVQGTSTDVK